MRPLILISILLAGTLLTTQGLAAVLQSPSSAPLVTDLHPYSFSVSWISASPVRGSVEIELDGRSVRINDAHGGASTTHLVSVPCPVMARTCKLTLKPQTSYTVRVYGTGRHVSTVTARTTPLLSPVVPLAAVGGHIQSPKGKPVGDVLIYVTVRHGKVTSVPLAGLTLANGGWLITLANAVTTSGAPFPLKRGDGVSIRALSHVGTATTTIKLRSVEQPLLMSKPLTLH